MDLEPLIRFCRAYDDLFDRVEPSWWGAVVSDRRFPKIHDVNYARVETRQPVGLTEIEERLLPSMERSGSHRPHVVVFHADDQSDLVVEASTRGEHLVWDLVMSQRGAPADNDPRVRELHDLDDAFWAAHRASLEWFGVVEGDVVDELQAMERLVTVPGGRRWLAGASGSRIDALAAVLVLEGVGYLDHVVTFPWARRRGLASALTRRAVAEATKAGAERTYLLADPGSAAVRMYEGLGFSPVAQLASWISRRTGGD